VEYPVGLVFKLWTSLQGMSPPAPEADRGCGQFQHFKCKTASSGVNTSVILSEYWLSTLKLYNSLPSV